MLVSKQHVFCVYLVEYQSPTEYPSPANESVPPNIGKFHEMPILSNKESI